MSEITGLPYTRYIKQVVTESIAILATEAAAKDAYEALQSAAWTETAEQTSNIPARGATLTGDDNSWDAYKTVRDYSSGAQKAYAGAVAYRIEMPDEAIDLACDITSIDVPVLVDRWLVDGIRLAAVASDSETPARDWTTIRAGDVALSAQLTQTTPAAEQTDTLTLTMPTSTAVTKYIYIYLTLEDYETYRGFWIEGAALIFGADLAVTFSETVQELQTPILPSKYTDAKVWIPFVANYNDYSARMLQLSNGPDGSPRKPLITDYAVELDKVTESYVETVDAEIILPDHHPELTIGCWFKSDTLSSGNNLHLFSLRPSGSFAYGIGASITGGATNYLSVVGYGTNDVEAIEFPASFKLPADIDDGDWHRIVVVFKKTGPSSNTELSINGYVDNAALTPATGDAQDTEYNPNVNNSVYTMKRYGEYIYIGGTFTSVGGTSRSRLARLNADGTLDTGFAAGVSSVGGDPYIMDIDVDDDGVVVVGWFEYPTPDTSGLLQYNLAKFAHSDGSKLSALSSVPTTDGLSLTSTQIMSDGKVLCGANYDFPYDDTYYGRLFKTDITTIGPPDAWTPNPDGTVWSTDIDSSGNIIVGGEFWHIVSTARNNIARITSAAAIDATFDPDANGTVYAVKIQSDGMILVGGAFTNIASTAINRIARLESDGTIDSGFSCDANGTVKSIEVIESTGEIIIAGQFTEVNSTARDGIAVLNSDGSLSSSYSAVTLSSGFNVQDATKQNSSSKVVFAGTFTTVDRVTRNNIAQIKKSELVGGGFLTSDAGVTLNRIVAGIPTASTYNVPVNYALNDVFVDATAWNSTDISDDYDEWRALKPAPAKVTSPSAGTPGSTTATITGTMDSLNKGTVTVFYGETDGGDVPASWDDSEDGGFIVPEAGDSLSVELTGLTPSTTYYYAIRTVNDYGTFWTETEPFNTTA